MEADAGSKIFVCLAPRFASGANRRMLAPYYVDFRGRHGIIVITGMYEAMFAVRLRNELDKLCK